MFKIRVSLLAVAAVFLHCAIVRSQIVNLSVDFTKAEGTWNMPALALGQGGLQSDPMIEPHIKEIRELRPRTIRLFLSEYYRIYPDHGVYDFSKLDPEAFVGGPAVAGADSLLVEGLIKHCAETGAPLDFLSWHLYSDSPEQHAHAPVINIKVVKTTQANGLAEVPIALKPWDIYWIEVE